MSSAKVRAWDLLELMGSIKVPPKMRTRPHRAQQPRQHLDANRRGGGCGCACSGMKEGPAGAANSLQRSPSSDKKPKTNSVTLEYV